MSEDARVIAKDIGVTLRLDRDTSEIVATPSAAVTPKLRACIKKDREGLVRMLFLVQAMDYLSSKDIRPVPKDTDVLNDSYFSEDLETFKETVRAWMRALMREAA